MSLNFNIQEWGTSIISCEYWKTWMEHRINIDFPLDLREEHYRVLFYKDIHLDYHYMDPNPDWFIISIQLRGACFDEWGNSLFLFSQSFPIIGMFEFLVWRTMHKA